MKIFLSSTATLTLSALFGILASIVVLSSAFGFHIASSVHHPRKTVNNKDYHHLGLKRRHNYGILQYALENQENIEDEQQQPSSSSSSSSATSIDMGFTSPVLKQVAPELLKWKETYGHPNIPLKNPGGNQCQILRRLHIQNKLTQDEIKWLENVGFVFHSMEDVYRYANFDELFERLLAYEKEHSGNNFQVPKKCPEDPELGAWVTGIRRLGKDGINPVHERRLEEIGFVWTSTRKCGSKFMEKYRDLVAQVETLGLEKVLADPKTILWIQAQQDALKRGSLSQTRIHYMGGLFGDSWTMIGKDWI